MIRKIFIFLVIIVFIFGCGRDKPPTGGPKDTTKPKVIDFEPIELTTGFSEDQIEFSFSEPIDLGSFKNALRIYPPIPDKEFSWSPQKISVMMNNPLPADQTYYITLTTRCKDLQNNPLEESFYSIFSTGDSIPQNEIIGKIQLGEKIPDYEGDIRLDLYSGSDTLLVTIRNLKDKKTFHLKHLSAQTYILNIFKDKNNDLEYDREHEIFSRQILKITQPQQNILCTLTLQDSTKPELVNIIQKNNQHIIARFSEDVQEFGKITISKKNGAQDSIENKKSESELGILDTYKTGKDLEIITEIPDTVEYTLFLENFSDYYKNTTSYDTISFLNVSPPDTSYLKIENISVEDGTTVDSLNVEIFIEFSKIVPQAEVKVSLINKENNIPQQIKISRMDAKKYKITPRKNLKNYVPYRLIISKNSQDHYGNDLEEDVVVNFLPISYE